MIITKTPFRISFFGGGTDYPHWYKENGGAVISTTINKYCYISCRHLPPFFKHKHRISYSINEEATGVDDIKHPSVRECLKFLDINKGLEIHYDGDLPAKSGLGSSSSFTVGLLHALYGLNGHMKTKYDLATAAIHVEQNMIKENVGSQDQVAAAFGGLNKIEFGTDGKISVHPIILTPERLKSFQDHLILFFTGQSRNASQIAKAQIKNMKNKVEELKKMREIVDEAYEILRDSSRNIADLGELMHQAWQIKRELSLKITTPFIDKIYKKAMASGALGGKLLGAGGGGFMLFFAKPEDHEKIRKTLGNLLSVPFAFDKSGSQVIYHSNHENV